jgi:hypothetical protein
VRQNRRPIVKGGSPAGECGEAAWPWPRLLARVMRLMSTVAMVLASDRGVFRRLGVRVRSGYGGDDVALERVRRRA